MDPPCTTARTAEGKMKTRLVVLFLTILATGAAEAQTAAPPAPPAANDLASKLINVPDTNWTVYGPGQTSKRLEKDGPKGYPAIRVSVTRKGKNAWDAGAVSPIPKAIGVGDVLFVAVYLRAPEAKDGETIPLPFIGLTGATAPYPTIASDHVAVTNQWKRFFASGKAAQAFAAGGAQASIHLAGDTHVVDLGPILVYDLGPDFNPARLPKNQ
jgi:hypothetical protein